MSVDNTEAKDKQNINNSFKNKFNPSGLLPHELKS